MSALIGSSEDGLRVAGGSGSNGLKGASYAWSDAIAGRKR